MKYILEAAINNNKILISILVVCSIGVSLVAYVVISDVMEERAEHRAEQRVFHAEQAEKMHGTYLFLITNAYEKGEEDKAREYIENFNRSIKEHGYEDHFYPYPYDEAYFKRLDEYMKR